MKVIKYPDGQINVQVEGGCPTKIIRRVNSYEDLFILKSEREAMDNYYGVDMIHTTLVIPCMFGQRSDKRFQEGESFGLKIITDFISAMNFNKVKIFDPHSDVTLALINNSVKISSFNYVQETVNNIVKIGGDITTLTLVSPDAGAYKKVFKYAEDLNLPLVAANKFRDLQGNVTLNILGNVKDKECLIVDDLLDGGYTFILLAQQLRLQGASKVFLYISHGMFSKGYKELEKHLDGIYCTNSYKEEYFYDSMECGEQGVKPKFLTILKFVD